MADSKWLTKMGMVGKLMRVVCRRQRQLEGLGGAVRWWWADVVDSGSGGDGDKWAGGRGDVHYFCSLLFPTKLSSYNCPLN